MIDLEVLKSAIEERFGVAFCSNELQQYIESLSCTDKATSTIDGSGLTECGGRQFVDVRHLFEGLGEPFSPSFKSSENDLGFAVEKGGSAQAPIASDDAEAKEVDNNVDNNVPASSTSNDDNNFSNNSTGNGDNIEPSNNAFTSLDHLITIPGWISLTDNHNRIPLHFYASVGDIGACEALVLAGSDKEHTDFDGNTASDTAEKNGFPAVAEFLSPDDECNPAVDEGGPILAALSSPPPKLELEPPRSPTPDHLRKIQDIGSPARQTPRSLSKKGDLAR